MRHLLVSIVLLSYASIATAQFFKLKLDDRAYYDIKGVKYPGLAGIRSSIQKPILTQLMR